MKIFYSKRIDLTLLTTPKSRGVLPWNLPQNDHGWRKSLFSEIYFQELCLSDDGKMFLGASIKEVWFSKSDILYGCPPWDFRLWQLSNKRRFWWSIILFYSPRTKAHQIHSQLCLAEHIKSSTTENYENSWNCFNGTKRF